MGWGVDFAGFLLVPVTRYSTETFEVSWYDAIYFCNKFSEKFGFTPVYSVNGTTDVSKWNYTLHNGDSIRGEVTQNTKANEFRLPTVEEWQYAAKGGQKYTY